MMAINIGWLAHRHARQRDKGLALAGWLLSLALLLGLPALLPAQFSSGAAALLHMGVLAVFSLAALNFLLRAVQALPQWLPPALLLQALVLPLGLAWLGPVPVLWLGLLAFALHAQVAVGLWMYVKRNRRPASAAPSTTSGTRASPGNGPDEAGLSPMLQPLLGLGLLASALSQPGMLALAPAIPEGLRWAVQGLAFALPLALLGAGLLYTQGFARARQKAEQDHAQFEQRMQERVTEMERNFGVIAEQRLEQVTERERKRIAADLHDDLGAKLLTIVHTSESDRISSLAREALEEMRLSVRGLTGKPVQLLDALGDWRAEVVSRLGQANINAEWKSPAEDIVHTLPARAYVQTTRIFREAVSNIIKHSGGTNCTISCTVSAGDFIVVIQDNGQGIPAELDGRLDRGHGMASMKSRAKQMHGQCLVESGPGWGTVIRLTIPL